MTLKMVGVEKFFLSNGLDCIPKEQWKFCVKYMEKIQDGNFTMEIVWVKVSKIVINAWNDSNMEVKDLRADSAFVRYLRSHRNTCDSGCVLHSPT
jgi:hypothetical protein